MTEEDEEFNRIEREATMRKESVKATMTKREWVGLTDEEIEVMANDFEEGYVFLYRRFAQAIEAKLREKNT